MQIYNGTAHELNFYHARDVVEDTENRKLIAKDGATPYRTIPKMEMLNAHFQENDQEPIGGIPDFVNSVTSIDPLPDGYDIIIVSGLYLGAAQAASLDTSRVRTVKDPVLRDGKIVGCLGLMRIG